MSRTYKAVQATQPGKLEVVERAMIEPAFGQVRIRVEACGVCHSDALAVEGGFPGLTYPRVPGHEVIGKIEAIGPGVHGWKEGQRVGVGFMSGHCGHCENCRRGDFVNCQNQPISGVHSDGGYAEMMIAQASGLAAIPDDLIPTEAAPLLCAGLTTFNALRNSKARPGELVAIQDVGGLGHLGIPESSLRDAWVFESRPLRADRKRKVSRRNSGHIITLTPRFKSRLPRPMIET